MKNPKHPMGCSQWLAYGKKYGYWDYYRGRIIKAIEKYKCGKHKKLIQFIIDMF